MRGIAGLIHFDSKPVSTEQLQRLVRFMALGKFDRITQHADGPVGFAHLQRDHTPEDRFEHQPLLSGDKNILLVTDALLENRTDLAAAFGWSASESATLPDSAFVLAAYEKWGESCPIRLEGKWAFAVWHTRERRLFAAVDHFSFRPFYYARFGPSFAFATTLRGLLALPEINRAIDDEVLADFLLFTRSDPARTLYRGIKSLPAAHHLRAAANGAVVKRYWQADHRRELKLGCREDYAAAFNVELERAIAASLRTDGNIGIMVSGGLDSASVTAIAGEQLAARGRRLQAIHRLPPPGDPRKAPLREHDESPHVRRMQACMPHIDFHFLPFPSIAAKVSLERWNESFDHHCVPLRGAAFETTPGADMPQWTPDLQLMLMGLGGNYTASLEEYPSAYFLQLFVQLRWTRLWRELHGHHEFYGPTVRHLIKHRIALPLLGHQSTADDGRTALLNSLNPDFVRRAEMRSKLKGSSPRWEAEDFSVKRRMAWILNELMPQNRGACRALISPEYTCQGYSPLMSHRLNEFCMSLPIEQQIREGKDRLLLRQAMRGRLPDDVIWRKTRGFPTPRSWQNARAVVAALPEALAELEQSALVANYIDLRKFRHRFTGTDETELRRVGATRFIDLFNLAWFLRWLERSSAGATV